MATKTFKIGEYAKGGIITAIATNTKVTIITKEWDYSNGSKRGSNQSNAKELYRFDVDPRESDSRRKLTNYLTDESTPYYADKIVEWAEQHTKFEKSFW